MIESKIYVVIAPNLTFEQQEHLEHELHLSVGGPSFFDLFPNCWLVRCNHAAKGLHQFLEEILTDKEDFAIYELATEPDYVHNIRGLVRNWTNVHF